MDSRLGRPRVHVRRIESTNTLARELAAVGAPHGTLVTATEQTAGRGRQGRAWSAPAGTALVCSWVIREPVALLSLAAGVAVAELSAELCAEPGGAEALLKWPNDVLIGGRKVAGILVEGRPQERWAVLGIGINVAVQPDQLTAELRERAATLGLAPAEIEPTLARLRDLLEHWLAAPPAAVLDAVRARDALRGRPVAWGQESGIAAGIDDSGRLVVTLEDGSTRALDAGEVHLGRL
ncbi:MAG: biotin--[acetyl-CoA-carboxylase] ligase [Conexibacteraceae bacterium]|nr:biotin--[acetyl-CoA-carboxylase] ligase [Conexibacteraceae bacterium]